MAFISLNSRVVEHRTRLVCLGETPSPRVRCRLALFTYLLTYRPLRHHVGLASVHAPAHQAPHRLLHAGGLLAGPASPGIRWNRHSNR